MIKKVLVNSILLIVFFIMIGAPIGSMLITKLDSPSTVLSSQSNRENTCEKEDDTTQIDTVPEDIEEIIRKLEQEYYQSTQEMEPDILLP